MYKNKHVLETKRILRGVLWYATVQDPVYHSEMYLVVPLSIPKKTQAWMLRPPKKSRPQMLNARDACQCVITVLRQYNGSTRPITSTCPSSPIPKISTCPRPRPPYVTPSARVLGLPCLLECLHAHLVRAVNPNEISFMRALSRAPYTSNRSERKEK